MNSLSPAAPTWLPFLNTTAMPIPGGAVLEPAGGYDSNGRIRVRQCTVSNSYAIYFAGPEGCPAGSFGGGDDSQPGGMCRTAWPMTAAAIAPADQASYTYPVAAGSKAGDWYLRLGQTGFQFVDPIMAGMANAIPTPGAPTVPASGSSSSGSVAAGSGGGSSGTFIGYVYRDICTNGVLQQWRAQLWTTGMTPYVYLFDNGCCACPPVNGGGSGSGSSGSGSTGSGSGSTVTVSCCANALPTTLTVTISGTGGGSFPMTYSGGNWDTGIISLTGPGAGTLTLRIYCFGTTWAFQNNTGSPTYTVTSISGPSPSTCSPFVQTFTGTLSGAGSYSGSTRTFTVTT